jgi:phosphonoacetaldehyde hydrolase
MRSCVQLVIGNAWFDKGSNASVIAMKRLFQNNGISITETEIRKDLGLPKKQHLNQLLQLPDVNQKYFGFDYSPHQHLGKFLREYEKEQIQVFNEDLKYTKIIDGAQDVVAVLKKKNIKIALTSCYNRKITNIILKSLSEQQFDPDFNVSTTEEYCVANMNTSCLRFFNVFSGDALVFGNTIKDLHAAQTEKIKFYGIGNDHCSTDDFYKEGAIFFGNSIQPLKTLIDVLDK